jgi:hypothetical protein
LQKAAGFPAAFLLPKIGLAVTSGICSPDGRLRVLRTDTIALAGPAAGGEYLKAGRAAALEVHRPAAVGKARVIGDEMVQAAGASRFCCVSHCATGYSGFLAANKDLDAAINAHL